jgi:hypothetical protein
MTSLLGLMMFIKCIVIKPGPAQRVDPGPGQLDGWTGLGKPKYRGKQKPGKTRLTWVTQQNPVETHFFF